jgi:hypothetical protein
MKARADSDDFESLPSLTRGAVQAEKFRQKVLFARLMQLDPFSLA